MRRLRLVSTDGFCICDSMLNVRTESPESLPYIEEGSAGWVKDSKNMEVKIQYFPRTMNHFRI